ncbi:MAG: hypothetical protein CBE07_003140 [Pelagibacteraceae bacterium TMED247]|nr:MAG: hypothetical protein CBE07_003140 [Pelagibacteraceae bacterium TMED247]|tara:strand:+ start:558 stop:1700 length:1143 start_codon:yes stop_codon:yes gene_type:complete
MADSAYKVLGPNDKVTTRTLLHEAIPITGTIVSGTYGTFPNEDNIKNFSHGMFQSVYDYPYLSSSANHIFDIAIGVSAQSGIYSSVTVQKEKKRNIYNQMAQVLVGYDVTGSVLQFDGDGDFTSTGDKMNDCIFLVFSRLLIKDEIKKESFNLELGVEVNRDSAIGSTRMTVMDVSASNEYRVNSPAGEYGILYATGAIDSAVTTETIGSHEYVKCGLIYYQAGVVVLTSSLFIEHDVTNGLLATNAASGMDGVEWLKKTSNQSQDNDIIDAFKANEISASADSFRNRIYNLQFNNTTELNSTVYFCRANHNEFNYSSNPTYLSESKVRVKNQSTDVPVSYITTIGMYNDRRELLAVAKLSEPLKKTPDTEFTLRVRLDY